MTHYQVSFQLEEGVTDTAVEQSIRQQFPDATHVVVEKMEE